MPVKRKGTGLLGMAHLVDLGVRLKLEGVTSAADYLTTVMSNAEGGADGGSRLEALAVERVISPIQHAEPLGAAATRVGHNRPSDIRSGRARPRAEDLLQTRDHADWACPLFGRKQTWRRDRLNVA